MKKILLIILLFVVGCNKTPSIYDRYVKEVKESTNYTTELPCKIEFYIDNVNENRIIYQVIIDEPSYELKNVKALVVHNAKTKDIFPSIGIVDEPITLNQDNKGIILMGYIDKTSDIEFKVLIETDTEKYLYHYSY